MRASLEFHAAKMVERNKKKKRSKRSKRPESLEENLIFLISNNPRPNLLRPEPLSCECQTCPTCRHREYVRTKRYLDDRAQNLKAAGISIPTFTEQEDAILRRAYENNKYGNNAHRKARELLPSRTSSQIYRRALDLRLIDPRLKQRFRWTAEELSIVEKVAYFSPETIQRFLRGISPPGAKRTRSAIIRQIHSGQFRRYGTNLNQTELAQVMGVSVYTVERWRESSLLQGCRSRSSRPAGAVSSRQEGLWVFPYLKILRFLLQHPDAYCIRKMDHQWFCIFLEWATSRRWSGAAKVLAAAG